MDVVGLDVGIVGPHLGHGPLPQVAGIGEHVGLVTQGESSPAPPGPVEGEADHPLHAHPGVDRLLGGDLVRGAPAQRTPRPGVEPLGVLAHHHQVAVGGLEP